MSRVFKTKGNKVTQVYKPGVHNGMDIVGTGSTLDYIVAHSDGTVVAVRKDYNKTDKTGSSYGNYVKIKHYNISDERLNKDKGMVNGKIVNIASYQVKPGDVIEIAAQSKNMLIIKENLLEVGKSGVMPWLTVDADNMKGQFVAVPKREEVSELEGVNEQLVVELYSR